MPRGSVAVTILAGGMTIKGTASQEGEGQAGQSIALPAGKAGAISAAAGVDGLVTGHGFVHDDEVAVHWTAGGVRKCRYGMVVDVASTNAVTFTVAGAGDALPAEDTAVVLSKEVSSDLAFDGDAALVAAVRCDQNAHAQFYEDGSASDLHLVLTALAAWFWIVGCGYTSPLATRTPTAVRASNASTTAATLAVGLTLDTVA